VKYSRILIATVFSLSCLTAGASLVRAQDAETPGEAEAPDAETPEDAAPEAEPAVPDEEMSERQRASTRFRRGVDFYNNGDYRAALIEFQRAYEIAPNYRVLFNLGQASFQLHDYVEAKAFFERYLAEGGAEISEDRRTEVQLELTTLSQYIATVDVTVNVDGAEIAVDGQVAGQSPLDDPLVLSTGRREVIVSLEGYAPVTRVIDVAGGETASLEIELLSLTEKATKLSTGFWISAIAVGAVAIATITTGVLAFQANSNLEDQLNTFPNSAENIAAARSDVQNLSLATDILLGVLGVGLITTVLIGIFGRSTTEVEDEDAPDPDAVAIRPTANGVAVSF
jgi:hypothetical protein